MWELCVYEANLPLLVFQARVLILGKTPVRQQSLTSSPGIHVELDGLVQWRWLVDLWLTCQGKGQSYPIADLAFSRPGSLRSVSGVEVHPSLPAARKAYENEKRCIRESSTSKEFRRNASKLWNITGFWTPEKCFFSVQRPFHVLSSCASCRPLTSWEKMTFACPHVGQGKVSFPVAVQSLSSPVLFQRKLSVQ